MMANQAVHNAGGGSTPDMKWCIVVRDGSGQMVDKFIAPTMKEAQRDFEQAGYEHAFSFGNQFIIAMPCGGL